MLSIEYRLVLGHNEFMIKIEAKDEKEFIDRMMFFSSLPKSAPGGALDLALSHRVTQEGHHYYSIICESEKKEFKFGQKKETTGGGLYPKGWSDMFGTEEETDQSQGIVTGPLLGVPATKTVQAPAPKVTVAPAPVVGQVVTPTVAATPTVTPNPQVQQAATNVLARFGIAAPAKG